MPEEDLERAAPRNSEPQRRNSSSATALENEGASSSAREDPSVLFPARLLGMGLIFTWDWSFTSFLSEWTFAGTSTDVSTMNAFSVAAQVVVLIVLACASSALGPLSRRRRLFIASALCGAVGPMLPGVSALACQLAMGTQAPSGVLLAATALGGLLMGLSFAVLMLGWAEVYSQLGPSGLVMEYGALSLLVGAACYGLISQCSVPVKAGSIVALPLVSYAMCSLSWGYVGVEPRGSDHSTRYSFPWKPVLIMGVCGFSAAFIDVSLFSQGTLPHVIADILVGGGLALVVLAFKRSVKPVWLVGVALASMAVAIACVAILGSSAAFPSSLLAMTSYVIMTFFICALLSDICRRRGIPSMWLFGFALAARILMDHLGGFAVMFFPDLAHLSGSPLALALISVVGLLMIGVVTIMWMGERSFSSEWAIRAIEPQGVKRQPTEREIMLAGCSAVTRDFGLTQRESELLEMLVEGLTYQQICSQLLLSANTVKTHARHMYAKLGVHTREEACKLVRMSGR